ncbi:MAG: type II toxin-antitoxin system VapC family toxin [Myxococcaceae bacterium]
MKRVLVDTSVWIDHFRITNLRLTSLLMERKVCAHPFVTGELACGSLGRGREVLSLLRNLPQAPEVSSDRALELIESERLMGKGVGWTDVHLLASVRSVNGQLWSRDRRLVQAASRLGVAFE